MKGKLNEFWTNVLSLLKYSVGGFLTSVLNVGLYALGNKAMKVPMIAATAVAWLLSNIFSFCVNKFFVFAKEEIKEIEEKRDGEAEKAEGHADVQTAAVSAEGDAQASESVEKSSGEKRSVRAEVRKAAKTSVDATWAFISALLLFLLSRLVSGVGDTGCMWLFAEKLNCNDMAVKVISAVGWGVLNYLLGRFVIFRHKE